MSSTEIGRHDGTGPVSKFDARFKSSNMSRSQMGGMVPDKPLSSARNFSILVRDPRDAGMVPLR